MQAKQRYREPKAPTSKSLRSVGTKYAVDFINRTATRSNLHHVSPDERYYGTPKPPLLWPFLHVVGFFLLMHPYEERMKAEVCFYIGPARQNFHDTSGVLMLERIQ